MGSNSTKMAEKCSLLSKDEVPIVAGSFKFVSKNSERIREEDLMKNWGGQMDARLAQYIANFLFGPAGNGRQPQAEFQRFAELYVFCVRGTIDERMGVMLASLTGSNGGGSGTAGTSASAGTKSKAAEATNAIANGNRDATGSEAAADGYEIPYPLVKEFVEAVVSSYIRAIRLQGGAEFKSWESHGFHFVHECVQKLAESLSHELAKLDTQKVTRSDTERWLQNNPTFLCMLTHVFLHLFQYRSTKNSQQQQQGHAQPAAGGNHADQQSPQSQQQQQHLSDRNDLQTQQQHTAAAAAQQHRRQADALLPSCDGLHYTPDFPACTDIAQILFVNAALPPPMRHKWRFLFSAQMHGESFSTLLGRIIGQGPSVLIVEDSDGYIFGGYASASWAMGARFVGDDDAFLFTLRPRMRVFPSTAYNRNYQYLNLHQQTLPNGLGMGGQHNYWGLWLDSHYGLGESSESCSTFRGYTQLSAKKSFTIRNVEVWGVGDKPAKEDEEAGSRSVLDGNLEEKALLEMVGRKQYSDGYRDEPPPSQ